MKKLILATTAALTLSSVALAQPAPTMTKPPMPVQRPMLTPEQHACLKKELAATPDSKPSPEKFTAAMKTCKIEGKAPHAMPPAGAVKDSSTPSATH